MAKNFMVKATFKGIDKMSKTFKKIGSNGVKAMNKISNAFSKVKKGMKSFSASKFGRGLMFGGAIAGAFSLTGAISSAIKTGMEFEQTMTNATAKFGVAKGTQAFKDLETVARDVGRTTQFSASEAADGLNFLAMAGFNAKQSISALPGLSKLAIATSMDLATATDIVSDSLGAFGKMAKDPNVLATNLSHMNDVMAKTTLTSNTDLRTLFETVKMAGPVATSAGESMEEFSAMVGIMASSGVKGTSSGTALRSMFVNLQKPTKAMRVALKNANVHIADSHGKMRSMSNIIGQLHKGMKNYTSVQKNAALATIFGKNALSGAMIVYKAGEKGIKDYAKQLKNSDGATDKLAKTMQNTTEGRVKTMNSALGDLSITFFKIQKGPLNNLITGFTKMINVVNKAINDYPWLGTIIQDIAIALGVVAGALTVASVAMGILNVVMALNPFVWIAIAIAATVAMLVYLGVQLYKLMPAFSKIWQLVTDFGNSIIDFGKKIALFVLKPIQNLLNLASKIPMIGGKFKGMSDSVNKFADSLKNVKNVEVNANVKTQAGVQNQQQATAQIISPATSQARIQQGIVNQTTQNNNNHLFIKVKDPNDRTEVTQDKNNSQPLNIVSTT